MGKCAIVNEFDRKILKEMEKMSKIEELMDERRFHDGRIKKIDAVIVALQDLCEHEVTEIVGNNHNDTIRECINCKKMIYG